MVKKNWAGMTQNNLQIWNHIVSQVDDQIWKLTNNRIGIQIVQKIRNEVNNRVWNQVLAVYHN